MLPSGTRSSSSQIPSSGPFLHLHCPAGGRARHPWKHRDCGDLRHSRRAGPSGGQSGVIVGRSTELEELDRLLESAVTGDSGRVLVVGDPGMGTTALLTAFAARAKRRGAAVTTASVTSAGDLLRSGLDADPSPAVVLLDDGRDADAAQLADLVRLADRALRPCRHWWWSPARHGLPDPTGPGDVAAPDPGSSRDGRRRRDPARRTRGRGAAGSRLPAGRGAGRQPAGAARGAAPAHGGPAIRPCTPARPPSGPPGTRPGLGASDRQPADSRPCGRRRPGDRGSPRRSAGRHGPGQRLVARRPRSRGGRRCGSDHHVRGTGLRPCRRAGRRPPPDPGRNRAGAPREGRRPGHRVWACRRASWSITSSTGWRPPTRRWRVRSSSRHVGRRNWTSCPWRATPGRPPPACRRRPPGESRAPSAACAW